MSKVIDKKYFPKSVPNCIIRKMYRNIIIFCCLLAAVSATNVQKCKKGQPFPLSVDIEGCVNPPCDAVKGTSAVMDVHFVGTKNNIRKLTAVVHATTLGLTVPYELPNDVADVCRNLMYGASCPIDEGEDVVYRFNFFLESYYPEINVKVQVSLEDENSESIACFAVDIKVKKGPK